MTTSEIALQIFSTTKWYAGIKRGDGYMNAQTANRIKARFNKGTLSDKAIEEIFNNHGYYIADKSWVKK